MRRISYRKWRWAGHVARQDGITKHLPLIYQLLEKLELTDAPCCDTTALNIYIMYLHGACVILEQNIIYLPCQHHIYEVVLQGVFEEKISNR